MNPLLSIDPGASGGLAWRDCETTHCENMPEGMTAQVDRLRSLKVEMPNLECFVERVGTYMPGNSGPAAAKFAWHCGSIVTALYALGIPTIQVTPQKWQKAIGTWAKDKSQRKREIKEAMARRYPHLSVTLKTADALGILTYALQFRPKQGPDYERAFNSLDLTATDGCKATTRVKA